MDKENENSSKNQQEPEKGTENPSTNHALDSDNYMEASSYSSKGLVCVSRYGKTPSSDDYIMCDILSRLRSKYLMRFKSVCTHWKLLIETDSYLIDLQYRCHKRGKRPLLFISSPPAPPLKFDECDEPEPDRASTIDFTSVGPTEVQKLELDRSVFGIPKQTVAGLVCITSGSESFLIYNPSTGERTPWIKTTTVNENIGGERRREVDCIAFGYSPRTKEHKVLCISSVKKKGVERGVSIYIPSMPFTKEGQVFCLVKHEDGKEHKVFEHVDGFEEVGADEEQVCEVFTVGENTWRRIDAVPPYSLVSKVCYVGELLHYNQDNKSVYVKGKIYWRFRYTRKGEVIVVFDVRTEKFRVISIPEYVTNNPQKYPQTVELLEVDGHIAVVNFTPDCPISLWILVQDGGSSKWSHEKVIRCCDWRGNLDLSIEAISGTDFIIMKRQMSETTYLYDRVKNVHNAFNVNDMYGLSYQPGELREILTLVDSLTPVCTKRCSMF